MGAATFIVPFGRDGAADRAARLFSLFLGRRSALAISIENQPGAGGRTGVERANALVRAKGPTLLLGTPSTHVLLPTLQGADAAPDESLRALIGFGTAPNVLLVTPRLGAASVAALLERARAGDLVYASAGAGQTIHLCTALFCAQAGVSMEHRPYDRGSATAYADLAAGRVHVYFDSLIGCRGEIAAGRAIALAVSGRNRSALLPDVPTLTECGLAGFLFRATGLKKAERACNVLEVWLGAFAAHLPRALAGAALNLCNDAVFAAELAALGLEGGPLESAGFLRCVEASVPPWREALAHAQLTITRPS